MALLRNPESPIPPTMTSPHIAALAGRGVKRHFKRGAIIIQEGDQGNTLFIIVSGRLRAYSSDANGKEITLGVYGADDYVGEMSLDGGPRSANVETLEPTVCSVVSRDQLTAYITEQPAFAMDLIARLIRRARLATESARNLALIDVYGRLTRLLDQLADKPEPDGTRSIRERVTHRQLAGYLACSREMVSRLLKDLEKGGYVRVHDRFIVIVRPLPERW